jgi:hypothetical protein
MKRISLRILAIDMAMRGDVRANDLKCGCSRRSPS